MKANELRIGNRVDISKIVIVRHETLCDFANGFIDFQPIPLTEEWLLKFGFEKIEFNSDTFGHGTEYHLTVKGAGGFIIEYMDDFSCCLLGSKSDIGVAPNLDSCKYVHQLQNLYFALTNEELI